MGNLILVPTDQENLRETIEQVVPFSRMQGVLPQTTLDQLQSKINNPVGCYCWAMTRANLNIFNEMSDGDIVIFKPNQQNPNEGYFKYKGRVVFKTDCPDLGRKLWASGSGWDLIYFFEEILEIKTKHSTLAKKLNYANPNPRILPGTTRVAPERIPDGDVDKLLNSIDEQFGNIVESEIPEVVETDSVALTALKEKLETLIQDINDLFDSDRYSERDCESLAEDFFRIYLSVSRNQINFQDGYIDIVIELEGIPIVVVEVKRDLNLSSRDPRTLRQAYGYANERRIQYVIITNGNLYALYDLRNGAGYEENFKFEFELNRLEEEDIAKIDDLKNLLNSGRGPEL